MPSPGVAVNVLELAAIEAVALIWSVFLRIPLLIGAMIGAFVFGAALISALR